MNISSPAHIHASHLRKVFTTRGDSVVAFDDISFDIRRNEFFCIVGPSGCGKTSVLRCLAGLEPPTSGTLRIDEPAHRAMVFQEQALFPWMSLRENVRFLMRSSTRIAAERIEADCDALLSRVGLAQFAQLYPHQVSGGMRQRVSLIRSIAVQPDILLMDEPFVFVDFQTRLALHELLLSIWQEQARTVVFVTHDIEEAVTLADRILVMSSHPGRVKTLIDVNLPRPRDVFALRKTPQFGTLVGDILDLLRAEQHATTP